jgi:hypothetical protein
MKIKQVSINQTKLKLIGLNRFQFGFGFNFLKKKKIDFIIFLNKNQIEPKILRPWCPSRFAFKSHSEREKYLPYLLTKHAASNQCK